MTGGGEKKEKKPGAKGESSAGLKSRQQHREKGSFLMQKHHTATDQNGENNKLVPAKKKPIPNGPRLKFTVTQQFIDKGIAANSGYCMIAESLKAAYPQFTNVAVDMRLIRATDPQKELRYIWVTPELAGAALVLWDQGTMPPEFEVVLNNPWVQAAPQKKKRSKELSARDRARNKSRHNLHRALKKRRLIASEGKMRQVGGKEPALGQWSFQRTFGVKSFATAAKKLLQQSLAKAGDPVAILQFTGKDIEEIYVEAANLLQKSTDQLTETEKYEAVLRAM
jgi:hypothetical protein